MTKKSAPPAAGYHVQIRQNYLVTAPVRTAAASPKQEAVPTDWLLIIDVSGSMWGELPKLREQLKSHLRDKTQPSDTVTMIAFSGNAECYRVFEREPLATLPDVNKVYRAIDRWLSPIGMTNFVLPFEEAKKLIAEELGESGRAVSVMFNSDGCETCGNPLSRVLALIDDISAKVSSFVVVEWGSWSDHKALEAMAARAGGQLVHSRDVAAFEPHLLAFLGKRVMGTRKLQIRVPDAIDTFAFAVHDGALLQFEVLAGNVVIVPEHIPAIHYVAPRPFGDPSGKTLRQIATEHANGSTTGSMDLTAAYGALACYGSRNNAEVVEELLREIGDIRFAEKWGGAFGIENLLAFVGDATEAAFGALRFLKGHKADCLPPDDAPTIPEVFALLHDDPATRILIDSEHFGYCRIGRPRIPKANRFSAEEIETKRALADKLGLATLTDEVREVLDQVQAIVAQKGHVATFQADAYPDGIKLDELVTAADRANLSFRIRRSGTVDLRMVLKHLPADIDPALRAKLQGLDPTIRSVDYKTYTVLKDGRRNMTQVPLRTSRATWEKLVAMGATDPALDASITHWRPGQERDGGMECVLQLGGMAVVNRAMRQKLSPYKIFSNRFRHLAAQARGKVMGHFRETLFKKSEQRGRGLAETYGADVAAWLVGQGVTDGGFKPEMVDAPPSGDVYKAKVVKVEIKGLVGGKFPKVEELLERRKKIEDERSTGKSKASYTLAMRLMVPAIEAIEGEISRLGLGSINDVTGSPAKLAQFETWLEQQERAADMNALALGRERAGMVYVMSEAHVWPWADPRQGSEEVTIDGEAVTGTIEMTEPTVAL
jgi:hypothetical protein